MHDDSMSDRNNVQLPTDTTREQHFREYAAELEHELDRMTEERDMWREIATRIGGTTTPTGDGDCARRPVSLDVRSGGRKPA